jgi:hypothetical protein
MSQHFPTQAAAAMYVAVYDEDAQFFSGRSTAALAIDEKRMLRESGGERIAGGPRSHDELVASILELRYPHIAEARAMLVEPEPGSERVTFTFPGGTQVTVPPMAEDPRVTAPLRMTDEEMLRLVEDGGNDYVEGIGERGGYVSYSVEGNTLTVKVQVFAGADADDLDELVTTERQWRIVPVEAPPRLTDGHAHQAGAHPGWLGHDGHPVHRHEMSTSRTEWQSR